MSAPNVRNLPDGRLVVRGRLSLEPANDIERRIVELMRQDREWRMAQNRREHQPWSSTLRAT